MIKVVHITTVASSLRYLLLNQLLSIQASGYEVSGISAPGDGVSALVEAGIPHISVSMTRNMTPGADVLSLWRLYQVIRKERFTIVHTHNPKPGLLGQLAARMAKVPIVINTLHGFYFHDHTPRFWRKFYISMEKVAARNSDVILSQNSEDIQTAVQEGICKPDLIKLLGNGIDIVRFDRKLLTEATQAKKREALSLPKAAPVVGFVGRLVREKGILELMEAAVEIRKQLPTVKFLFVGPVDHNKSDALTPMVAADYDLADSCIFAGFRHDLPELYGLMDVFVLPSHREGFPRSPMEASAMGVPCVVTDIRGCREAVVNNENGLLVKLQDSDDLAQAIIRLLKNRELRERFGRRGRQMAEERFDERLVFEKVKNTYARLLQDKGLSVRGSGDLLFS